MYEDEISEPNTKTVMDVIEIKGHLASYKLEPVAGKQHQPTCVHDVDWLPYCKRPFLPKVTAKKGEDYLMSLQLLAKTIQFTNPFT